ncbi:InlB B-repeat-containing protein, partial [Bifidobacterium asteroides]
MHLVSRLRRASATTIVLLGLLAGLGIASAQADAPILDRQTPRVSDGTSATLPNNATSTPLSSPSPIQTTTPLSTTPGTPSPATPSPPTGTPDSAGPSPAKPSDKTDEQAAYTVRFDPADGSTPTQETVKTGALATPPQQNPQRPGFRFGGWTHDGRPYDFRTPVLQDTTLKAQWSKTTDWTLSPDHGPATGTRLTIKPPSPQEPCYVNVQAAGEQILGLTGDGRIHTWTQDHTPKQVPSPARAPAGFRYLQAAAGSRRQAAIGSDQRIYTWDSQQPAPTLLDTGPDTLFTSISINDDRLLAVDRQGQVHTYQASDADSRNPKPKPLEQATTGLPGQAQAVLAVASASRTLIVDADGQAWAWNMNNTVKAKPERIRQERGTRTVQAQALNQGFLLLDANGQAWYLADSTTKPTSVSLPEGMKAGLITTNKDQAIITDKEGRVWAWKPGGTPVRADNSSQPYTQAVLADGRITAVSRQGSMFTWGLDGQGRPGKPVRRDTISESTLQSASMDGQPLTPDKTGDAWQTEVPARQPGQATITITGKEDNRPFTRSLTYTVDQPLTRDVEPRSTFTVRFDTGGGNPGPADQHFPAPYGRVKRPSPDPMREGYLFDGWFTGQAAYDFSRPVDKDLTLTA